MSALLDRIPLTSVLTVIVAVVGGVIAIVNPDVLSFEDYAISLGVGSGGLGILGMARTKAGKGVAK